MIEEQTAGRLTPRARARRSTPCATGAPHRSVEIRVGLASCGDRQRGPSGARGRGAAVREAGRGVAKAVGCGGMCHREPLVEVVDGRGRSVVYGT